MRCIRMTCHLLLTVVWVWHCDNLYLTITGTFYLKLAKPTGQTIVTKVQCALYDTIYPEFFVLVILLCHFFVGET